jgi:hypothetical protein
LCGASGVYHSAVLDIGVHVILTTTDVVNAIYGAIGVQPAANNMCMFAIRDLLDRLFDWVAADYLTCTTSL